MKKHTTIRHGKLTFTGRTKALAAAERDAHLERLFSLDDEPLIVPVIACADRTSTTWIIIVWRVDGGGFAYRVDRGGTCMMPNAREPTSVIVAARRHVAQRAYDWLVRTGSSRVDAVRDSAAVLDPEDRAGHEEHAAWCKFQSDYRRALDAGCSADDARIYALPPPHVSAETIAKINAFVNARHEKTDRLLASPPREGSDEP